MKTAPEKAGVTITATAAFQHVCPHAQEVDHGSVTITWETAGATIELHSLREYLDTWADVEISHEAITQELRDALGALDGLTVTGVNTSWTTAGMGVTCII